MEHGDHVEDGKSNSEPKAASGAPNGLEPVSQWDSTSVALSAVEKPNPFWSEKDAMSIDCVPPDLVFWAMNLK